MKPNFKIKPNIRYDKMLKKTTASTIIWNNHFSLNNTVLLISWYFTTNQIMVLKQSIILNSLVAMFTCVHHIFLVSVGRSFITNSHVSNFSPFILKPSITIITFMNKPLVLFSRIFLNFQLVVDMMQHWGLIGYMVSMP